MRSNDSSPFPQRWLPYLLLAPQLVITLVFFVWPTYDALSGAFYQSSPFGLGTHFAGLANFTALFTDPNYLHAFGVTALYAVATTLASMGLGLLLAVLTEGLLRGHTLFRTLFIWPYAVAPAIAGALWMFMFAPQVGPGTRLLIALGIHWNYTLHGHQAMLLVIALTAWQQIAYNFLFFTAGLQGIPASLLEAAALDGSGPIRRFWDVTFPLLAPTTFFLLVMNTLYVFFDTFGVIQIVTQGGPANATTTLVYKLYEDGFQNLNLGSAAAQSIILMTLVGLLTVFQFRYLDRKVHYQ
ncbi:sn-glycerol-3-phosphate ABC transporter permease UgpA [Acidihalobacter ferrooxydans]|uniref:sn-glycerol-3-phosphate transport system permease protein UgpA n=1 Tax=Acidihalobacter ferrooxydans TaxID=1765967 RepID=A0A1P8UJP2_9GAMM|nr:sn-glycerol-3-phosphate ABC transporter permease UgpA [Acidihalobacter ferrooxydans]APZ44021.1 glycerol-3-phosphate transporter permease [Acidihalobacter ferrooxydans]